MQHNDGGQQPEGRVASATPSVPVLSAIPNTHPAVTQLRVAGRVPVVTASAAIGVVPVGQQGIFTTVTCARPVAMAPQAVMVPTQTVSRLLSPATSLSANSVQLPATLNVLQRHLSAPGVVGLSAVTAQDLQQVLQQASQQPITLLTAAESVSDPQRPRLARPLSYPHAAPSLPPASSVSATGATIHHHGQSPVRGAVPVVAATLSHSNLQHSLLSMNLTPQQQQQLAAQRRLLTATITTPTTTTTTATAIIAVRAPSGQPPSLRTTTSGPPARKKIRLEEKQAPTAEVATYRDQLVELKRKQMKDLKAEYFENLTEMFFLQSGQNLMDYHNWKKRPTPQLLNFLKSGKLDSDEEEDVLQVKEINSEVKVLTNPGSNVPLATPVAISTTLPPMVSALSQQGSEHRSTHRPMCLPGFSHSLSAAFSVVAPSAQTASADSSILTTSTTSALAVSSSTAAASSSQLQLQLARGQDAKAAGLKGQQSPFKQQKSPPLSPNQRLHTRQQSLSAVYDNISGSSQEVIVERAKQEAQVVQRVSELRKEGLWSSKRLPRVQEPPRQKAHWDYLLEEMTWLAADFVQERKWKKAAARKVARMVNNYFKELEQKEVKAEKEEGIKLKKIASHMAKMVKEFWTNIEKVVQFKQQTRLEEKKKRALDLHLNFIVDQTEKYSSWLTEGLQGGSISGSLSGGSPSHSSDGDDFDPSDHSHPSDDEETIDKEEEETDQNDDEEKLELEELQKEGELSLAELLKTLPQEVLDAPAALPPPLPDMEEHESEEEEVEVGEEKIKEEDVEKEGSDKEFAGSEAEAVDVEDTIDEQEKHEKKSFKSELKDLQDEGEMSIEELAAKYAGAYDSDFEMPQDSSSEEESEDDSELDSDDFEIETESSSAEEEEKEEAADAEKLPTKDPGLAALMQPVEEQPSVSVTPSTSSASLAQEGGKNEEKEEVINDIAAQALSLQPKGYTLETTEVKTKVPHLLKHTLREYQHVGLDWLATMHEKRLNGILADEMGLGKTIQTIALLAHLACEKGIWGPHLIVVPTSVMLNWEMELKKWCPAFKILTYYGNQKERKLKRQGWTKTNAFHVCITSYKLVVQDHQAFRRKKWKYLILDEAQNIKNFKSQRWQMLLNFSSQRRLLLTGTPLQNSLMELWSLMHFLMPNVFQSHRDFKEWFANPLTGMIEGSQEYNESLIKRLHKVLRPFLLRRLKNEVEKQMPKKYEHVVMCKLSKRQRFLYDDFMSQAKTRETLAAGHYMSVINILMQLRKVCNHPNLFDPRPVVSPLYMNGLVYHTASLATHALVKDPLEEVDMQMLFPSLAEMERDLPAFIAHRVKQLKTNNRLIEEVDTQPDPAPPLPHGQLKPVVFRSVSPALAQTPGRGSPVPQATAGSPVELLKAAQARSATPPLGVAKPGPVPTTPGQPAAAPATAAVSAAFSPATISFSTVRTASGQTLLLTSQPRSTAGPALVWSSGATTLVAPSTIGATTTTAASVISAQSALQAKVLPQQATGVSSTATPVLPSQPITVQIQQTEQGTRLMIPTGQLSQLPASLFQIVQTSSGQQLIATSTPTAVSAAQMSSVVSAQAVAAVTTTASSTVNGPSMPTTVAATSGLALVTTGQLRTVSASSIISSSSTSSSSPSSTILPSTAVSSSKPVMRVSPMVAASSTSSVTVSTTSLPASLVSSVVSTLKSVVTPKVIPPVKKSEMYLESVHERRRVRRQEKLKRLARVNSHHCSLTPMYGPDLLQALTFTSDLRAQTNCRNQFQCAGYANCQCVHSDHNGNLPRYYWHETTHLSNLIHTPEQFLTELKDVLDRFAFSIPTVISPGVQLRVAHPDPSHVNHVGRLASSLRQEIRPMSTRLNDVKMKMSIQFPELRLIQYDCGKLQTMDVLLRRLKTGAHRVLIFTQMTKMLDVLEAFLNYHGHRYLRLDGTTKVEQRQQLMDRFNADKRIFCFILSTRSGGIGVNLTGADTVIFYDSDWNPTMDAQAQDRCHRIGQTRDVHIYRLISEMTVEENILKKANQKRLLGDLAIEGGNFTTAFFKEQTINDLFAQPTGLKALAEQKRQREELTKVRVLETQPSSEVPPEAEEATPTPSTSTTSTSTTATTTVTATAKKPAGKDKDANIMAAFEQALCKAEDESDAIAATLVKAEQKAELAEFDENIPWDEREAEARKEEEEMSRAEMELAMLDKELTPIERFAVVMVESQMEDEVAEELQMAEDDIQNSKKDWELARLKSLKEEEERRAEMEEDEMLYTYLRDDAQVKRRLAKAGKVKKRPGRPLKAPRTPSPSLSSSEPEVKGSPRVRKRVALNKLQVVGAGGEAEGEVIKVDLGGLGGKQGGGAGRGRSRIIKLQITNGELVANGPATKALAVKKVAAMRGKKNNNAAPKTPVQKTIPNGDADAEPKPVKAVARVRKRAPKAAVGPVKAGVGPVKPGVVPVKAAVGPMKAAVGPAKGEGIVKPVGRPPNSGRGRGVGRPRSAAPPGVRAPGAVCQAGPPRPILNVPAMAAFTTAPTALPNSHPATLPSSLPPTSLPTSLPTNFVIGSPPRNKSPAVVAASPVTSPSNNVPPPWSNPNLVIRTRRAAIHSPVQVSGRQVIPAQTGVLQTMGQQHQQLGMVSGGMVRLVSPPGPVVALAASQPLQMLGGGAVRMRPAVSAAQLSLAGARVLSGGQQVLNAPLQGQLLRLPDGSTAVLGQIGGANFLTGQSPANQTIIVSGAQTASPTPTFIVSGAGPNQMGARAVLASNLAQASRVRMPAPRLTTQPQFLSAAGIRTVQIGPGGLTAPLTLRGLGLGGVPMGLNLVKAGASGVQLPIMGAQGLALRGGQIIQTSLGQSAAPQSYVLITPRVRAPAPTVAPPNVNGSTEKKGAG